MKKILSLSEQILLDISKSMCKKQLNKLNLTECETPPAVEGSTINILNDSFIEYECLDGYHIDNESNSVFECRLGPIWFPSETPVCLKGE